VANRADTVSVGTAADPRQITNVADGTRPGDAVNMSQFQGLQSHVDDEFSMQDKRISKIGAMGTALSSVAMNTAAADGNNRVAVGGGFQSGQSAFAVGVQHVFRGTHATVSLSGAFSHGENSVGVGAGMSW